MPQAGLRQNQTLGSPIESIERGLNNRAYRLRRRIFFQACGLSGSVARLGLGQQEEGDAKQCDGYANARRKGGQRNRRDLDQRRHAVPARHLLDEIGSQPFIQQSPP